MNDHRYPEQKTPFSDQLAALNRLDETGFRQWAFYPGMLFGAQEKWWGDRGRRPSPHEGIDLCLYTDDHGRSLRLDASSRVPVMFDGEILKIEEDFLGESIYVKHPIHDGHGRRLWTLYGHTSPEKPVKPGGEVRQGEIIASLSKADRRSTGLFPHLHLSTAWIPAEIAPDAIRWENLHDPRTAILLDPLHVMNCPYKIFHLDSSVKDCG